MARRIRSIKPEILDDARTAALPHLDWRLFVSMFVMADDYGNLHGHPGQVQGAALWATGESLANIRESLARLSDASLIRLYSVRGQPYIAIVGWAKHQKVDHPGKQVIPGPDQEDSAPCDDSRESRESLGKPREILAPDQDQGPGTVDQGKGAGPAAPAVLSLLPQEPPTPRPDPAAAYVAPLVAAINRTRGTPNGYRPDSAETVKLGRTLLKAGVSPSDALAAVEYRAAEWIASPAMANRVCPASLMALAQVRKTLDEIAAGPARASVIRSPMTSPTYRTVTDEELS